MAGLTHTDYEMAFRDVLRKSSQTLCQQVLKEPLCLLLKITRIALLLLSGEKAQKCPRLFVGIRRFGGNSCYQTRAVRKKRTSGFVEGFTAIEA